MTRSHRRRGAIVARGIALCAVLLGGRSAFALNPSLDVSQYVHTAWRIRDGFIKTTIQAIAQTADGYIWIGTESGLFRFDGVRVTAWRPPPGEELPSARINNLLTARDGTLWIATATGLASWNGRTLSQYPPLNGRYIGKLLEDRGGTMWVTAANLTAGRWTLAEITGGQPRLHGDDGEPGVGAMGLFEDRGGHLWVGTLDGLWRWKPGLATFFPLGTVNGVQGIAQGDDATLLLLASGGIHRFADGRSEIAYPFAPSVQPPQASILLRDRDGGLWVGTPDSGLMHVHHGIIDVFAQADGLSGARVHKVFEDREGNIWVVTGGGLDRFGDPAVATLTTRQGLSTGSTASVAASAGGGVWLASYTGLNRIDDSGVSAQKRLPLRSTQSIFVDRAGRLWVSGPGAAGILDGDRFAPVRGVPPGNVRAIAEDSRGIWLVSDAFGLTRVSADGERIEEQVPWRALKPKDRATAMTADANKPGLWLGFASGGIAFVTDNTVRSSYATADGLGAGGVRDLRLDSDGSLWVSTEGGLSRVRNGRVSTINSRNGLPCDSIRWVLEDYTRSLWIHTTCGLVRLGRSQIDEWAAAHDARKSPGQLTFSAVFDTTEGVRDAGTVSFTSPAIVATDGRLWFKATDGISVVDPHHLPINDVPPPVAIDQITADHKIYDPARPLPARVRDLQIDYTALSFVAPEKVRFRYKLEGYDADWQDAGNRRQAFYTNLPPRTYRFRVVAANNSGVWNETGAALDISIPPAYYQTRWFLALSAGLLVALVWTAHRVRLRIVEHHEEEISALNERLMKAQEQERIRIAGELHDGVMQQMLAVTMMLGTAKRKIASQAADAEASIEKIQEKVIQAGTDIRQLSHGLHPPLLQEEGLPGALRSYCEQFSATSSIPTSCKVDESARDLSRGAALALFRITQEALGNAAKHAQAKQINVRLARSNGTVTLTVSDDGLGFDRSRLGAPGGLGLVMMRERASQLNGTFQFNSAPGRGTTISVVIPFR